MSPGTVLPVNAWMVTCKAGVWMMESWLGWTYEEKFTVNGWSWFFIMRLLPDAWFTVSTTNMFVEHNSVKLTLILKTGCVATCQLDEEHNCKPTQKQWRGLCGFWQAFETKSLRKGRECRAVVLGTTLAQYVLCSRFNIVTATNLCSRETPLCQHLLQLSVLIPKGIYSHNLRLFLKITRVRHQPGPCWAHTSVSETGKRLKQAGLCDTSAE